MFSLFSLFDLVAGYWSGVSAIAQSTFGESN